jgi:hypothetical protein
MFVIFGSARRQKGFDVFVQDVCGRCHNPNNMQLVEISNWFSLFFIPIFKITKEFYLVCPHCGAARKVPNKEAKAMIEQAKNGAAPAVNRNVRAENPQPTQQEFVQSQAAGVDVRALIKNDIDRVMATIQDPAFLSDNRNFEKLYNSLKNGLVPKYNDPALVEEVLKEYFNI